MGMSVCCFLLLIVLILLILLCKQLALTTFSHHQIIAKHSRILLNWDVLLAFCRRKKEVKMSMSASCNSRTAFLESQQNIANNFSANSDLEGGATSDQTPPGDLTTNDALVKVHNRAPNNIETAAARVTSPYSAERAQWTRALYESPSKPQQLFPLKDYKLYSNKLQDHHPVTSATHALDARPLCSAFDIEC